MLRTTVVLLILLGITAMSAIGAEKIVLDTVRADVTPLAGGTAAERPQNWAAEGAAQADGLWRVERFTGNILL
ncbi:MAG: hypothetical protein FJ272_03295, partial [Planctomycetes bacterium]|nr:hypothetical protein [Planctomycetota bacterium]